MGATTDGIRRRLVAHAPELLGATFVVAVARASGAAPTSLVLMLVLLAATVLVSVTAYTVWGRDTSTRGVHARVAVQMGAFALLLYAAGAGPALVALLLLPVADTVRYSGSTAGPIALIWAGVAVGAGQLALLTGIAPSVLPGDLGHGLAAVGLLTVWLVGVRITRLAAAGEDAHERLVEEESRVRALLATASDVTIVISDAEVVYQSPSAERLLGYTPGALLGRRYLDLIHPDDRATTIDFVRELLAHPGDSALVACRLQAADGRWVEVESNCRNLLDDPQIRGFVVNSRDVSDRRALERQLAHRDFHDPLTGVANRALLLDRLDHTAARADRLGDAYAVLVVDLDGFKAINDTLGHEVGDATLKTVATRLLDTIRGADTLARIGGDEFAVLLEHGDDELDAAKVAQRALGEIRRPIDAAGRQVSLTASIGIAHSEDGAPPAEVLRNADIAMHLAKESGRDRFEVFETSMHVRVVERLELEADLALALQRGELELHYQPIVALADQRITSYEALLRWNHPTRGLVPPNRFIPLAEQSGVIVPIGRFVLREACRQLAEWRRDLPSARTLSVSVNVSMHQITDCDLVTDVREALEQAGLPAAALTLELTESALVRDTESTIATLTELKSLGVRIAIDDFGTGYSSLAYLHRFPVDVLKIDRSFVTSVASGRQSPALASAIVDLGRSLNLLTVAEGIEHDAELDQFRRLDCTHGQGFLFSRPVGAVAAGALLSLDATADCLAVQPHRHEVA
ncbi:putative bifunctional diguanylate cyclase/phosphodiesterase, partial [Egicoccus sp. AB-alg6-2]|uniref:putative bifunctional diguanylate cyclase/phosphodiesterase n=1 Tax=Egicoccus sp. AB-alg6-2 TaxID=3242692 RepID=UPI00359ED16C